MANMILLPHYSVIIPCYNSSKFIDTCFNSLTSQTIDSSSFEVIFVDDNSSDDTIAKIHKFAEDVTFSVKVIENEKNSGPGISRRKAAMIANGEYLSFCDSDDSFTSEFLIDIEKELSQSQSDIVIFDMSYILGEKVIRKNYTSSFNYGNKMSYLTSCAESLCNLVVKRDLFLSIPIIDIRNGEDLALVPLLIANAKKITHIDKSYYNYFMRSDSASLGSVSINSYSNMLLAFEHIRKYLIIENPDIERCVEFLGIKTVLYNSTLMAIKGGNENKLLSDVVDDFTGKYPNWSHNPLMYKWGSPKILYLIALKNKLWFICRSFVSIHTYLLTKR